MKVKELNKEILKLYYNKNLKLYVEKFNNKVFISDSYAVWILSEEDFIFDTNKFKPVSIFALVDSILDKDLVEGFLTLDCTKENKNIYRYLMNKEQDIKVKINEKYLKFLKDDCIFKIVDDHTPVLVYDKEELIGMICPVKSY